MQDKLKPFAFLYSREDGSRDLVFDCNGEYARRLMELGATETPLYAHPPTANPVDDRETPVGDHQMVTHAVFDAGWKGIDPFQNPETWEFAERLALAALTAARAQVEAESQRLREALEQCLAQFAFYADEHRKADKSEKAATNERFAQIARQALGDEA